MKLKLKWSLSEFVGVMLGQMAYGILTMITFGLAGHKLYNHLVNKLVHYSNLDEMGLDVDFKLTWKNYMLKIVLPPVIGLISLIFVTALFAASTMPASRYGYTEAVIPVGAMLFYFVGLIVLIIVTTYMYYNAFAQAVTVTHVAPIESDVMEAEVSKEIEIVEETE